MVTVATPSTTVALNVSSPTLIVTLPVAFPGTTTTTVPLFWSITFMSPGSVSILDTLNSVEFPVGSYFSFPANLTSTG